MDNGKVSQVLKGMISIVYYSHISVFGEAVIYSSTSAKVQKIGGFRLSIDRSYSTSSTTSSVSHLIAAIVFGELTTDTCRLIEMDAAPTMISFAEPARQSIQCNIRYNFIMGDQHISP